MISRSIFKRWFWVGIAAWIGTASAGGQEPAWKAGAAASLLLGELEKNGELRSRHSYPVQVLQFGKDLTLVALAGETVVDYAIRLRKEITGNPLWVAGYCNDVFGYVPSVRVQKEGAEKCGAARRKLRTRREVARPLSIPRRIAPRTPAPGPLGLSGSTRRSPRRERTVLGTVRRPR